MGRKRLLIAVIVAVIAACFTTMPAQATPAQASVTRTAPLTTTSVRKMDIDWDWYKATVWYSKYETQRIVATNGACSVVVGKAPGWVAKILSGACGLIAVWAGYALARDRCVGVKVSYFMALPYGWTTRSC